ncbi:hypothetical protein HPB52_016278 [Rhipicephalus sanguineus]|uniref:GDT1 family protein n=1 Tax=Rhipicephalus sanguineus TaxID=34632 RepID=A0A9D4T3Y5_RHISA|nr:hypothetical protein HPB52_016278 [Rhipicephalus sanguineus]
MIIFSEMGDKTFFITALMAMKHSKTSAIAGALSANALMSVCSAMIGSIASVMQKDYTHYLSVILLVIFGSRMIAEGYAMEKSQTKAVIQEAENETSEANSSWTKVAGNSALVQTFLLTFLGEWGDRSQISTIALAANESVTKVAAGAILGHAVCILVAAYGGCLIANRMSLRSEASVKEGGRLVAGAAPEARGDERPAASPTSKDDVSTESNTEFWHGFLGAISVIIVSELGDKTFFIAAILAMRHSRLVVFGGAIAALSIMTVLSAGLGFVTTVIPRVYTHYLSIALFVFFGVRMIREAYYMQPDEGMDEYEEVQKSLSRKEMDDSANQARDSVVNMEAGSTSVSFRRRMRLFLSKVFFQALTLTFVAEWGDRSQIATIILAAREDPVAVSLGAILGHSLCTLLAVIGGRLVAQWISVRTGW